MSWVIVDEKTGKAIMEVWTAYAAEKAGKVKGLKAVSAAEYLGALNAKIRAAA